MDIDFSQIYIVKPQMMVRPVSKPNEDYPNFVFSGSTTGAKEAAYVDPVGGVSTSISAIAIGSSLFSLPVALLIGAVTGGGILAAKISKDKSAFQSPIDDAEKKELQAFLFNHGITIEMAEEFGFVFPPGHPKVDMLYKRHPLAEVTGAGKKNVYIPHDKYDEILMAEREAELLKMLVYLGATKITITHDAAATTNGNTRANLSAGATSLGKGEVEGSVSTKESSSTADSRIFRLRGKKWIYGDKLDRSCFSWVNFEPSWEALIIAREIGGCTAAALDIRENTSFSTDKSFAAKVEYAVYSGAASAGVERHSTSEKVYLVQAEFGEFEVNAA